MTRLDQLKPLGRQGSWFAEWNGEQIPCVHLRWTNGHDYIDPGYDGRRQWPQFIAALANGGKAILTSSHVPDGDGPWRRDKYLAIWTVENVRVENGQLKLTYGEQLEQFYDAHGQVVVPTSQDITSLPRNPDWTRDELILALDLYIRNPISPAGKTSAEVVELSAQLGKLAELNGIDRSETFRNANGVYMKMMNFRRFDPTFQAAGKSGMKSGGKLDKVVWDEFYGRQAALTIAAGIIRDALRDPDLFRLLGQVGSNDDEGADEGGVSYRLHRVYERNQKLKAKKKNEVIAQTGALKCETCDFDFGVRYGAHGHGFIEVHHTKPVHQMKAGETTKLFDLAVLCANCHRMIHHRPKEALSLAQLKTLLIDHA